MWCKEFGEFSYGFGDAVDYLSAEGLIDAETDYDYHLIGVGRVGMTSDGTPLYRVDGCNGVMLYTGIKEHFEKLDKKIFPVCWDSGFGPALFGLVVYQ